MKWISQLEKEYGTESSELNNDTLCFTISIKKGSNLSEQMVGKFSSPELQVHIEGGEGNEPHVHICKRNGRQENIILRVCLCKAEYFREKDDKRNTLDCQERKALDAFFKSPAKIGGGTMWQVAVNVWFGINPNCKKSMAGIQQPNYQTIVEPK